MTGAALQPHGICLATVPLAQPCLLLHCQVCAVPPHMKPSIHQPPDQLQPSLVLRLRQPAWTGEILSELSRGARGQEVSVTEAGWEGWRGGVGSCPYWEGGRSGGRGRKGGRVQRIFWKKVTCSNNQVPRTNKGSRLCLDCLRC